MPSFKGTHVIEVQPSDDDVPYTFNFPVASSASANDGAIPYGETISAYTVSAHTHPAGTDATADLIASDARAGTEITVSIQWPTTNGQGVYHLRFVLTLAVSGADIEYDFNRVYAKDI